METITQEKNIEHPMETTLDIEQGTTVVEYKETVPSIILPSPLYDEKDDEIENKIEEIYATAMTQVATISDEIERVEGKYKARIGEVTAAMLNVALGAVREKRELKKHKDDVSVQAPPAGPKILNQTLVLSDRNELLRLLASQRKSQT